MEPQEFPLVDALDHEILMHRDVHFGGQFPIMLDYYRQEGKGINPEFSISQIERLAELEMSMAKNLAPLVLLGAEAERVAEAKDAYKKLRAIYEVKNPKSLYPQLIADLILAEDEEAEAEVAAIAAEKGAIVPALMDLLRSEEFYDPLFPGYGEAPALAAKCLGRIGDKRALIALFEAVGQSDFFADEQILKALGAIGDPAKTFLLKVVHGRPLNEDNEKAAIALIHFKDDPEVATKCFEMLKELDVQKDPCLPTYLVLACEGLKDAAQRKAFLELSKDPSIPRQMREDMKVVMKNWGGELSAQKGQ